MLTAYVDRAATTNLMFSKILSFDGLVNFMLKWFWCGSEGNSGDFYLWDIYKYSDYFCNILIRTVQQRCVY